MENTTIVLIFAAVVNSLGLGGTIGYLFTNEHERRNLKTDVAFLKEELKEVKQDLKEVNKANRDNETNFKLMEKDLQNIVSKVDEMLALMKK